MLHMAVTVILGNPNKHVGSCREFLAHTPAWSKENPDTTKSSAFSHLLQKFGNPGLYVAGP